MDKSTREKGISPEERDFMRGLIEGDLGPYLKAAQTLGEDEAEMADRLVDATHLLALSKAAAGQNPRAAAKSAAKAVFTKNNTLNGTYVVTKPHDAAAIGAHTDKVLEEHGHLGNDDDFGGDEEPPRVRWRTRPRRDGLELVDGNGKPVEDENGKPIQISYTDAEAEGREILAKAPKGASEETTSPDTLAPGEFLTGGDSVDTLAGGEGDEKLETDGNGNVTDAPATDFDAAETRIGDNRVDDNPEGDADDDQHQSEGDDVDSDIPATDFDAEEIRMGDSGTNDTGIASLPHDEQIEMLRGYFKLPMAEIEEVKAWLKTMPIQEQIKKLVQAGHSQPEIIELMRDTDAGKSDLRKAQDRFEDETHLFQHVYNRIYTGVLKLSAGRDIQKMLSTVRILEGYKLAASGALTKNEIVAGNFGLTEQEREMLRFQQAKDGSQKSILVTRQVRNLLDTWKDFLATAMEIDTIPNSPVAEKALNAKSVDEFLDYFQEDPMAVIGSFLLEKSATYVATLTGATVGAIGGPVLSVAGSMLATGAMVYTSSLFDQLKEHGADPKDAQSVIEVLSTHGRSMQAGAIEDAIFAILMGRTLSVGTKKAIENGKSVLGF